MFDDPDRFDVTRFADNPDREFGAKAQILSFGYGTHLCTGSQLARLLSTGKPPTKAMTDRLVEVLLAGLRVAPSRG